MLVIVYGTIGEVGVATRAYFESHGFQMVEKLYSAKDPQLTPMYTPRDYLSEEEFLARTDSLFRYEVGGIRVGCNQEQIDEAVYGEGNYLLTLSAKKGEGDEFEEEDFDILEQLKKRQDDIQQVYEKNVCLIYVYIDDDTLRGIVERYPPQERHMRMSIGNAVKENYLTHQSLFNHVVIYGGEESLFNKYALMHQFDVIFSNDIKGKMAADLQYGDVVIACSPQEREMESCLRRCLLEEGLSVFDNRQLPQGAGYVEAVADAVRHAKVCIPVISTRTLETWREPMTSWLAAANESGCLQVVMEWDDAADRLYRSLFPYDYDEKCVTFRGNEDGYEEALFALACAVRESMDYEEQVSAAARKAEAYRDVGEYESALHWQKEHLRLCRDIKFNDVHGIKEYFVGGPETAAVSAVKVARIFAEMGNLPMTLDVLRNAMEFDGGYDFYDTQGVLVEELLRWCAQMNMDNRETESFMRDLFFSDWSDEMMAENKDAIGWLNECMARYGELAVKQPLAPTAAKTPVGADQESIARHAERALALFEDLLKTCDNDLSRADLAEGYQRLFNYCEHFRMGGTVIDTCIVRLEELKSVATTPSGTLTDEQRALKLYLGDRPSADSDFDVFLSFKSEDETLATTVYDFLTRNGKRVFFSKKTLPQLGESDYEDAIFEAIEHAKHMVVVCSAPDYLKTKWVREEWRTFVLEKLEGRKGPDSRVILVLTDSIAGDKTLLPTQLRKYEIVKMSEFRQRLLDYVR